MNHDICDIQIAQLQARLSDVASMARRLSYALKRTGTNDKLVQQCVDLLKRYNLGGNILRTEFRFDVVSCSQCGCEFGPGNEGFSHCVDHLGRIGKR